MSKVKNRFLVRLASECAMWRFFRIFALELASCAEVENRQREAAGQRGLAQL